MIFYLIQSYLIFSLLYIINIEKQMSLPTGKLLFKYPIG